MSCSSLRCPCCGEPTERPSADQIGIALALQPLPALIVKALINANGGAVTATALLTAMYPEGGQSAERMYATLKESLSKLRKPLLAIGLRIESAGYAQGWRAVWV